MSNSVIHTDDISEFDTEYISPSVSKNNNREQAHEVKNVLKQRYADPNSEVEFEYSLLKILTIFTLKTRAAIGHNHEDYVYGNMAALLFDHDPHFKKIKETLILFVKYLADNATGIFDIRNGINQRYDCWEDPIKWLILNNKWKNLHRKSVCVYPTTISTC